MTAVPFLEDTDDDDADSLTALWLTRAVVDAVELLRAALEVTP